MSVKELRNKRGYSQEGLAKISGIALRTIQRIESGETVPQKRTLVKLAEALQVDVEDINVLIDDNELSYLKRMTTLATVLFIQPLLSILIMLVIRGTNHHLSKTSKRYLSTLIIYQSSVLILFMIVGFYVLYFVDVSSNFDYVKTSFTLFITAFGLVGFLNFYQYDRLKK